MLNEWIDGFYFTIFKRISILESAGKQEPGLILSATKKDSVGDPVLSNQVNTGILIIDIIHAYQLRVSSLTLFPRLAVFKLKVFNLVTF